jgi:hypothetical protein
MRSITASNFFVTGILFFIATTLQVVDAASCTREGNQCTKFSQCCSNFCGSNGTCMVPSNDTQRHTRCDNLLDSNTCFGDPATVLSGGYCFCGGPLIVEILGQSI